jgi:glycosyltransferase involved in cell wall biosynthesis
VKAQTLSKPSVLISGGTLGRGGAKTHLYFLCKLFARSGIDTTICATNSQWTLAELEEIKDWGIEIVPSPQLLTANKQVSFLSFLALSAVTLRKQFTSLYCISTGKSHLYLDKLVSPTTVSIYHEIVSAPANDRFVRQCIEGLDTIVANSQQVAADISAIFPHKPIETIPFLTTDIPLPPPSPRPAIGEHELRVVYLGRIIEHKRPDRLVKEWHTLSTLAPLAPARLDIYGYDTDGSLIRELQTVVATNELADRVCIHGNYAPDELSAILDRADVVVLPSLIEGLPLVLVEAMQRGIPIVATNAGGTAELGADNPDAIVTSTEWDSFVEGLLAMSGKLRSGKIDALRLHEWTERRYGYEIVANRWQQALTAPQDFFSL